MQQVEVNTLREGAKAMYNRIRQEMRPVGDISVTGLHVLGVLSRLPAGAQPSQIAHELSMTSSNVAACLRVLEAEGVIRRERDADDARRVQVFLTDRAAEVVATYRAGRDRWLHAAITDLLDEDEQRLLATAGELMSRLAAHHADHADPATAPVTPTGPTGDPA